MIRILRHFSVRLWLALLVALPLSFRVMPGMNAWFPGIPAPIAAAGLLIGLGAGLGLMLDLLGTYRIRSLIREGELWERAGIRNRAEKKYIHAVRIFDSIWISPWAARRLGPLLTKVLARFYLTCGSEHPGFRMAAAMYLKANPEDETLAVLWLGQLRKEGRADTMAQSVLTALADTHFANPKLTRSLIRPFLDLSRVDFSAKRLYRNFLDHPDEGRDLSENGGKRSLYTSRIHELMGQPDDPDDEGAPVVPEVPETQTSLGRTLGDRLSGRHPAASDIPIRDRAQHHLSRRYLEHIGRLPARGVETLAPLAGHVADAVCFLVRRLAAWGVASLVFLRNLVREKERLGFYLRAGVMGLVGIWLMFFVWNTLTHMFKSGSPEEPAQKIDVRIPKPFTIQVAAYLKQSHADRYVAVLEEKGITADIKKTGGGGKTWYLVRISEFPDKKSAADFGNALKQKKIIDDFFVSNK